MKAKIISMEKLTFHRRYATLKEVKTDINVIRYAFQNAEISSLSNHGRKP